MKPLQLSLNKLFRLNSGFVLIELLKKNSDEDQAVVGPCVKTNIFCT